MHIPVWAFSFVCICVSTALPKDKMQLAAMRKLCNKDIQNKHSTHCKDNLEQWEVFTSESCKINIQYVEKNTFEQRMWSVLPYFRRLLEAQFFLYYEEQVADIFVDIWIFSEALPQQKAPTVPSIWIALIKFIWAGERHLCTISYLIFVIFLHRQNFWRIEFTPKKRVNYDKIHSKLPIFCVITAKYTVNCQFFALNL